MGSHLEMLSNPILQDDSGVDIEYEKVKSVIWDY